MLSNVFLHYVLDEWFEREVQPRLKGHSFLIRFADDFVMGFTCEEDRASAYFCDDWADFAGLRPAV
jgi:hypothetical protein